MDSKDSRYAYVQFIDGINEVDRTVNGELVQFNYPIYEGETNLVGVEEYNFLQENFPERIKGSVVKQDNLMNVVNLLYDRLKDDISSLPEVDDELKYKLDILKSFEQDGVLKPLGVDDVDDLANKYFLVQYDVRKAQRQNVMAENHHK